MTFYYYDSHYSNFNIMTTNIKLDCCVSCTKIIEEFRLFIANEVEKKKKYIIIKFPDSNIDEELAITFIKFIEIISNIQYYIVDNSIKNNIICYLHFRVNDKKYAICKDKKRIPYYINSYNIVYNFIKLYISKNIVNNYIDIIIHLSNLIENAINNNKCYVNDSYIQLAYRSTSIFPIKLHYGVDLMNTFLNKINKIKLLNYNKCDNFVSTKYQIYDKIMKINILLDTIQKKQNVKISIENSNIESVSLAISNTFSRREQTLKIYLDCSIIKNKKLKKISIMPYSANYTNKRVSITIIKNKFLDINKIALEHNTEYMEKYPVTVITYTPFQDIKYLKYLKNGNLIIKSLIKIIYIMLINNIPRELIYVYLLLIIKSFR